MDVTLKAGVCILDVKMCIRDRAQIEQVLGTQPLQYSLYSVKSINGQEAADDFAQYVTVIGGGRMYVDAKVDSPVGYYTVSLKVENEGHSTILSDIFTFDVRDN